MALLIFKMLCFFVLVFVDFAILDTKYKQKMDFVLHNHPKHGVNVKKRLLNCGVLWRLNELFNCLT